MTTEVKRFSLDEHDGHMVCLLNGDYVEWGAYEALERENASLIAALSGVAHASTEGDLFAMVNRIEAMRNMARHALSNTSGDK
jgi:hypothetical protein